MKRKIINKSFGQWNYSVFPVIILYFVMLFWKWPC